jgi:hypothetical protein
MSRAFFCPLWRILTRLCGDRIISRSLLPTASGLSAPSAPFLPASSAAVGYREILAELPEVVNVSKRLPAVRHKVVHHIVTTDPPIAAKFLRLDGEKLESMKTEFKQLEADGIIQRSTSPWTIPLQMVQVHGKNTNSRNIHRTLRLKRNVHSDISYL